MHDKKIYIENYNNANKSGILVTKNKGRDAIPCLILLKNILMKYNYWWHIQTKKHIIMSY